MSLGINNPSFDVFVQFAQSHVEAGKGKSVARLDPSEVGGMGSRTVKPASGDWVGIGQGRLASLKKVNNATREAFRKAVADMFGGESHIPQSVLKAMKLDDYGKGKPLTARRIMTVKAAIDNEIKLNTFGNADSKGAATSEGWTAADMPKIARAAHFISSISGKDEIAAIEKLSTPGTKENRLVNYGGRFLESLDSFKNGLRLMDTFEAWFNGVNDALEKNGGNQGDRKEGMNQTLLSASVSSFTPENLPGTEKFVFESIAHDPSFNLAETDANKLFGMENNVATHFFGRHLYDACTQTVAQIPPEKRNTFYTAVTMFFPVFKNAEAANSTTMERGEATDNKIVIARVLKNLDKIIEMQAKGELTFKNLARVVVPELPKDSTFEFGDVGKALDAILDNVSSVLMERKLDYIKLVGPVCYIMQETGCTRDEAIEAATGGKQQPLAPYVSSGTLRLDAFDGTTRGGRERLQSDLVRPSPYVNSESQKSYLPPEKIAFTFNFPGEGPIATNGTEQGRKNIETVMNRIESLCGKIRPSQALSVMTMVSQSALAGLKGGLSHYGIDSDEHSACDFTITKDNDTGNVKIRYSSPKELPFYFEWTATVDANGIVSTTPFLFMDEQTRRSAEIVGPKALDAGYHKSEIPMLAKALTLIKTATGCSDAESLEKTLDPQSRERRLFGYGGRFAASPENFSKGLALMDKFGGWYQKIADEVKLNWNKLPSVSNPTVRNANSNYLVSDALRAYEKFLFEEIAANDSLPLSGDNLDKIFGMEANPAMRFVGRGYTIAITDSVARMPVEARQILFAAFDAMLPLPTDEAGVRENSAPNGVVIPIARVMRHLDDIREMQQTGKLTAESVKTLLFPDVEDAVTKSLTKIMDEISARVSTNFGDDISAAMKIISILGSSGCTYDEAIAANNEGSIPPPAPYILSGTGSINDLDGTARGARKQAVDDLKRPSIPESIQIGKLMFPPENRVFTVNFPDGTVLTAGSAETDAENIGYANVIADKVEVLVGVKHQAQLASVMIGLSQSAHGPFLSNSAQLGFVNEIGAEHSALTYTFSRNDDTGAVTIRYSEPQGFPTKFHWETTFALDGSAVTTPLVLDK